MPHVFGFAQFLVIRCLNNGFPGIANEREVLTIIGDRLNTRLIIRRLDIMEAQEATSGCLDLSFAILITNTALRICVNTRWGTAADISNDVDWRYKF